MFRSLALLGSIGSAAAGTILWDGRFNASSATEIAAWSWSDQGVSPYQYYIHGDGNMTEYVNFDSTYKNPADTGSDLGVKITLDSTAYWEGQTMRRTELIPQTSAAINKGKVYYHFSIQRTDVNPPSEYREHQIAFFESHFTELKAGWISGESGTSDALLRWNANSATQWNTTFEASVWHNVAYGIDFDAGSVEFYHSTGSDDLTLTVPAVTVSASSNGADWHLGVLELPRDGYTDSDEDLYFSGVYIESGDVTLSVAGPGNVASSSAASSSVAASSSAATTVAAVATSEVVEATSSAVSSAVSSAASSSAKKCTKAASSAVVAYSSSVVAAFSSSATASAASTKKCTKPESSVAAAYSSSVVAAYSTSSASKSKCTKPASSLASAHASSVSASFSASAAASTAAAAEVVNTSSSVASANPTTLVTVTTAAASVTSAENSISSILAAETVAATATGISDARKKAIDTVVDIVASMEESMAQAYDKANNL